MVRTVVFGGEGHCPRESIEPGCCIRVPLNPTGLIKDIAVGLEGWTKIDAGANVADDPYELGRIARADVQDGRRSTANGCPQSVQLLDVSAGGRAGVGGAAAWDRVRVKIAAEIICLRFVEKEGVRSVGPQM